MLFPAIVAAEESIRVRGSDCYDVVLVTDKGSLPTEFAAWHEGRGSAFDVVEIDFSALVPPSAIRSDRFPAASFVRLYLAEYFGDRYRRILYVDSDTEIRAAIGSIFDISMSGRAVASADDLELSPLNRDGALLKPGGAEHRASLGLDCRHRYANAGVLLIDSHEWQRRSIAERIINYAATYPDRCIHADQDAFNAVLRGDYCVLSPRWNYCPTLMRAHAVAETTEPIILHHYLGPKPWTDRWNGDPASAERFVAFFKDSPWPTVPFAPDTRHEENRLEPPQRFRARLKAAERAVRSVRKRLTGSRKQRLIEAYLRETIFADI
jgi:lipopolysaccharide biosynthesis glycosyltransferase